MSFLQHVNARKNHKYIYRIPLYGGKYRYFYTQEELDAYKKKAQKDRASHDVGAVDEQGNAVSITKEDRDAIVQDVVRDMWLNDPIIGPDAKYRLERGEQKVQEELLIWGAWTIDYMDKEYRKSRGNYYNPQRKADRNKRNGRG